MSIFDFFKFGRRKPAEPPAADAKSNPAAQTAPGLRAIRQLWDIPKNSPVERITDIVGTDIYAGQRTNGIPRRRHPVRRPRGRGDTGDSSAY